MPNIKELNIICWNKVGDSGAIALSKAKWTNLESFSIGNLIGQDGIDSLIQANWQNLKNLTII